MNKQLFPTVEIGTLELAGEKYAGCVARFGRYANGNLAIIIDQPELGEEVCVATVNIGVPGVFIKDYSENSGLLAQLVQKELVEELGAFVQSGFVQVPEVKLIGKFAEAIDLWSDYK